MQVVLMSFLSLGGVYQGPGAPDEDRTGGFERGGWLVPFVDQTFEAKVNEWTSAATRFLFGRRTYEDFSRVWPTITDPADQIAGKLNGLPKLVVSRTGVDTPWGPTTVITEDLAPRIASLKQDGDGELQVHGSGRLARSLLAMGLVDELRIVVAPVVVGQGRKLFGDTDAAVSLDLLWQDRTPSGLLMSRFNCAEAVPAGTYVRGETNVAAPSRPTDR